jgi:hypothetical protein
MDDRVFLGVVLAMFALYCGHPVIALLIFLAAID